MFHELVECASIYVDVLCRKEIGGAAMNLDSYATEYESYLAQRGWNAWNAKHIVSVPDAELFGF